MSSRPNRNSIPRPSHRSASWHTRGYLPHRDCPNLLQFITFRLHDSVPADMLQRWKSELSWRRGLPSSDPINIALQNKIETFEDLGHGDCHLRNPFIWPKIKEALEHFHSTRYQLLEWSIMPNHVHVLIETFPAHPLEKNLHSWKSFTAKEANQILHRTGEFWMPDYFDRFIRNETHRTDVIRYIHTQGPQVVAQNA
jgi:hypothetical protein